MQRVSSQTDFAATRNRWPLWLLPAFFAIAGAGLWWTRVVTAPPPTPPITTPVAHQVAAETAPAPRDAQRVAWQLVNSFPHDPNAFTQGLLWHNGGFYESTGLEGQSTLRRVEFPSGKVLQMHRLPANIFAEGLVLWKDKLIQISWQNGIAFVYDRETFKLLNQWKYEGEGWGLTHDNKHLIMSDGSDILTFRDPETFAPTQRLSVTMNGTTLRNLNELEYINGEIWANIWQTDLIVRINPQSGQVKSFLDLGGLLPDRLRTGKEDVLNGIAYDAQTKRLFITGKFWPRLFQIRHSN